MIGLKHVKVVLIFLAGVFLVYLSLRKINLDELVSYIRHGHYWIAVPVFAVSISGYVIRSLRWKLLLNSMGNKPKTGHLFAALSMGYAVNFATPRFGELTRCLVLKKTDNITIEQSLISVFIERVIDTVCLLLIVVAASLLNYSGSSRFVYEQVLLPLSAKLQDIPWPYLIPALVVIAGLCIWVYRSFKSSSRIKQFISQLTGSVYKVLKLREKMRFGMYTILIWACYFLMTYLWFGVFDETRTLSPMDAFVIMAVGSIGRSVPVHGGGMGAYHYLVSNAFTVFGVSLLTGNAMAFVIHGAQLLFTFALGVAAWIWLLIAFKETRDDK
jgi:uncharacterized protein (TIRG00374 family)